MARSGDAYRRAVAERKLKDDYAKLKKLSAFMAKFKSLLFCPTSSDLVLKTKDEDVPAHKFILCVTSDEFKKRLKSDKTIELDFSGFSSQIVKDILTVLYTDEFRFDLSLEEGAEIIKFANDFTIPSLIEGLENFFAQRVQCGSIEPNFNTDTDDEDVVYCVEDEVEFKSIRDEINQYLFFAYEHKLPWLREVTLRSIVCNAPLNHSDTKKVASDDNDKDKSKAKRQKPSHETVPLKSTKNALFDSVGRDAYIDICEHAMHCVQTAVREEEMERRNRLRW